jgi:hypothetical protein
MFKSFCSASTRQTFSASLPPKLQLCRGVFASKETIKVHIQTHTQREGLLLTGTTGSGYAPNSFMLRTSDDFWNQNMSFRFSGETTWIYISQCHAWCPSAPWERNCVRNLDAVEVLPFPSVVSSCHILSRHSLSLLVRLVAALNSQGLYAKGI